MPDSNINCHATSQARSSLPFSTAAPIRAQPLISTRYMPISSTTTQPRRRMKSSLRQLRHEWCRRRQTEHPAFSERLGGQPFAQHHRSDPLTSSGMDTGVLQQQVEVADHRCAELSGGGGRDRAHATPVKAQVGPNQCDRIAFCLEQQQKPSVACGGEREHQRTCLQQALIEVGNRKLHRLPLESEAACRPFDPVACVIQRSRLRDIGRADRASRRRPQSSARSQRLQRLRQLLTRPTQAGEVLIVDGPCKGRMRGRPEIRSVHHAAPCTRPLRIATRRQ